MKYFLLFILLISSSLSAQYPFQDFKVEHYDVQKGLSNDFVFNIHQSLEGFIWMNGYNGFSRFDGLHFENFSAKTNNLIKANNMTGTFAETADSSMWFCSASDGLIQYKHGELKSYMTEQPNLFYRGKTKSGGLIISLGGGSTGKYAVFDIKTKKYRVINRKQMLIERYFVFNSNDSTISKWIVDSNKLYIRDHKGNLNPVNFKTKRPIDLVYCLFMRDSKGRTWMTTADGLYYWDENQMNVYPGMESVRSEQPNPSFGMMVEDKEQGLWVSAGNGKLAYKPEESERFYEFPSTYLNFQTLHNITVDREGNIWIASDRGIFKIYRSKIRNYASQEGIENNRVSAVCQSGPNSFLVVNPYNRVYQLENNIIKPLLAENKFMAEKVGATAFHAFTDSKNNQWICCAGLIIKFTGNKQKYFSVKGNETVRYACEGNDGKVYFGVSFTGIGFINEKDEFQYLNFPGVDFSQYYISFIRQLKDGTWLVGTYRTGVYFISPSGKVTNDDLFSDANGIPVFSSHIDSTEPDAIWFSTGKGLIKYKNGKKWAIENNAKIPELSLFQILPDKSGKWWFPNNNGILYAEKKDIDLFVSNEKNSIKWGMLNEGDGMNNRQCVGARHSIVTKDGRLMILSIGGLVEINPEKITTNSIPPLLAVNKMSVDDSAYFQNESIHVSPGNHRYIFYYSVLSFTAPEKNQIQFRLVGYDTGWIRSSGDTKAFYTNLPPGKYQFEVLASNNDGVWAKSPATFTFMVEPFYYQTIWFRFLILLASLAVLYFFINWRTNATKQKNILLEKEVARQTAELRESLETLKSTQSQLIQSEKMASLGELTAGIAHEIQNPLNFVNNFSEVNAELIEEAQKEMNSGNQSSLAELLGDIKANSEKITFHGNRADAIVKSMLQHSRKTSAQKELTDINALCDEYLRLAYHGLRAKEKSFNAQFETDFDLSLPKVNVVSQDIGRVILNLINNAFYAVNERYKKEGKEGYVPQVRVSTRQVGDQIEITVTDNGGGIPPNIREKIFQPFFTTKPTGEGTGLGLSMSYDIITKGHGGKMEVVSKEGEGSSFILQIPM